MLEISKMIKCLSDTESELKRIIQATQVHERGINIEYKVKIVDNIIIEFYITFDKIYEDDKFITALVSLICDTMHFCDDFEENDKITRVFFKYLF